MKQLVTAIGIVLLAFHSVHAAEKELVLFVSSRDAKNEWTRASLAWGKLFYNLKGEKKKPIDLTKDQIEQIRKLSDNLTKALGKPSPGVIPMDYAKGVMTFSLTLPGSEKTFATLLLEDDEKNWAVAIELRDYLDNIGSKEKPLKK